MTVIVSQDLNPRWLREGKTKVRCKHCGAEMRTPQRENRDNLFCCGGCENAWDVVHGLGLDQFYKMVNEKELTAASSVVQDDIAIFDVEEFQSGFVNESEGGTRIAELLIEGVTCYACVWLIRQAISNRYEQVTISINQATGTASLTWFPRSVKLSEIVAFIGSLGYKVLPRRGETLLNDQAQLVKVGVGLFLMMNVMSFALVEYLTGADGLDPMMERYVRWISAALTAIALLWPGREFFVNTKRSMRAFRPSIDGPILIGLLVAYVYSLVSTIRGAGNVYFDSICAVVALVITGRYVQLTVMRRNQTRMAALMQPRDGYVLAKRGETFAHIPTTAVHAGDLLRLLPGDLLPFKMRCLTNCGEVNLQQLSGECDWKEVDYGSTIPAGATIGRSVIEGEALEAGASSYTASLLRMVDRAMNEKGQYQRWSDRAAMMLFLGVIVATFFVLLTVWPSSPEEAIHRAVAMLLVACPCTFAIGVPLTVGTAMSKALSEGILFRSQRALEVFGGVREMVFDKTGTLTHGDPSIVGIVSEERPSLDLLDALASLEEHSSHHASTAVARWARSMGGTGLKSAEASEQTGQGVYMTCGTGYLHVGNIGWITSQNIPVDEKFLRTTLVVAWNGRCVLGVNLDDELRSDSNRLFEFLRSRRIDAKILSGDRVSRTKKVASQLGLNAVDAVGETTPAGKSLFVRRQGVTAMVGNGLNDAAAMADSAVGIAVANASHPASSSADICLLRDDLTLIARSWDISRIAVRRMRACFAFAFIYNCMGMALAATGHVSPVVAAILMPASSLIITRIATAWTLPAWGTL